MTTNITIQEETLEKWYKEAESLYVPINSRHLADAQVQQAAYIAGRRAEYLEQQTTSRQKAGEVWDAGHERSVFEQHPYHKDFINNIPPDKQTTLDKLFPMT